MRNFSLELPVLEDTISQLMDGVSTLENIEEAVRSANDVLVTEAWAGAAKDVYVTIVERWSSEYKSFLTDVRTLRQALSNAATQADTLNTKALGFAGILGSPLRGIGTTNILSLDSELLESAKADCVSLYDAFDMQSEHAKKAENQMVGFSSSAFTLSSMVSSFVAGAESIMGDLDSLRTSLESYSEGITAFQKYFFTCMGRRQKMTIICNIS